MRKLSYHPISVGLVSVALGGMPAFAAGSVQSGKVLAEQWCTNCHIVDRNSTNATESQPVGPDFMSMKGVDAATLKARLRSPHPVMSKFPDLTDQQVSDLVAYIASEAK